MHARRGCAAWLAVALLCAWPSLAGSSPGVRSPSASEPLSAMAKEKPLGVSEASLSRRHLLVQQQQQKPQLGRERVHMQTPYGEIVLAFYPEVAPITAAHILKLFKLGGYDTNHVFRVDKGFVAQVAAVDGWNRKAKLSPAQQQEAAKKVPAEFSDVPHVRGTLSMGRYEDPDSGTSSFSMLLGRAQHLDHQYTVFGEVVEGLDVLAKLETLETKREGIFVMPKERIPIESTYVTDESGNMLGLVSPAGDDLSGADNCGDRDELLQANVCCLSQRRDERALQLMLHDQSLGVYFAVSLQKLLEDSMDQLKADMQHATVQAGAADEELSSSKLKIEQLSSALLRCQQQSEETASVKTLMIAVSFLLLALLCMVMAYCKTRIVRVDAGKQEV